MRVILLLQCRRCMFASVHDENIAQNMDLISFISLRTFHGLSFHFLWDKVILRLFLLQPMPHQIENRECGVSFFTQRIWHFAQLPFSKHTSKTTYSWVKTTNPNSFQCEGNVCRCYHTWEGCRLLFIHHEHLIYLETVPTFLALYHEDWCSSGAHIKPLSQPWVWLLSPMSPFSLKRLKHFTFSHLTIFCLMFFFESLD